MPPETPLTTADDVDYDGMGSGAAGMEIDDQPPLLVRPYVGQLQAPAVNEPRTLLDGEPASDQPPTEPVDADPAPTGILTMTAPTDIGRASVPRKGARRAGRGRRRYLAIGGGVLILTSAATALTLSLGERPAATAPDGAGIEAQADGHIKTTIAPGAREFSDPAGPHATAAPTTPDVPAGSQAPSAGPGAPGIVVPGIPAASDEPSQSQQPPVELGHTGRITGAGGLCLDGDGSTGRIRLWNCDNSSSQTWTMATDGTVRSLGQCMQGADGHVRLSACDGGSAQQWRPGSAGALINSASGLCLSGPSPDDQDSRAPQRVATCNGSGEQQWNLP